MERAELKKIALATGCAVERGGFVFLTDLKWGADEQDEFGKILGMASEPTLAGERGWFCLPSGGTSGRLKFARHDEVTLGAAVSGFCGHFGLSRVNAVDVLPPHHVSGLLARVRCAATGGRHVGWSWKELEAGRFPELTPEADGWVLSLVPTQLQRLLGSAQAREWLRRFRAIFVGGGPAWAALTEQAAEARLPVALCYGMTETAAMVAALRPEEFARGDRDCGRPMSHARVEVVDEATGLPLPAGETGRICIAGESVFRGYFPGAIGETVFTTDDLGRFTKQGHLEVLGRRDAVIITGGKKVFPDEVEAALRASGEFGEVAVIGLPDADWGQRVVACHARLGARIDMAQVQRALEALAVYKRPKAFIEIDAWPHNATGKVNRAALARAAVDRV
jgi:O-succinylbenzoic acid--CoA ligase